MRLTLRGPVLLLLTALLGLVVGVLPASAHSRLLSITPKDGASLPTTPTEVVLTFNESVNPQFVTVRVTDGEGTVVAEDATASGATVTVPVSEPLAAGSYKVTYRVVSADSHPISGSTAFSITGDGVASPTAASTTPSAPPSTSASPEASSAAPSPSAAGAAPDTVDSGSGGSSALVWVLVVAGLAAAVAAVLYAVRSGRERP
ncbi:copper resistance protein CopC [Rothia sp. ARF10]|nr:copper resistance protein CopC [Rothia sp. ARF10]